MRTLIVLCLTAAAVVGLAASAGCLNQESVASRTATEWVTDNAEIVTEEFVRLTTREIAFARTLQRSELEHKIRDNVTWEFSNPACESEDECELLATAVVPIDVSLPFDGDKIYVVSLPFDLRVDTERREVTRWTPDVPAATVREVR